MQYFFFGEKFNCYFGIIQLMDDLNDGLCILGVIMFGGGNFVVIFVMFDYFYNISVEMLVDGLLFNVMINYDGLQGKDVFVKLFVILLCEMYGWNISEKNIILINGSQSGFFYLFNLFAGKQFDGVYKKIFLFFVFEYIGYGDVGIDDDIFVFYCLEIELFD